MKIRVRNAVGQVKYTEHSVDLDANSVLKDNLQLIKDKLGIKRNDSELKVTIVKNGEMKKVSDLNKSLVELNFDENDSLLLEDKAVFIVSAAGAIIFAYSGPIVVFTLFLLYSGFKNLQFIHYIAYALNLIHYGKRIYENIYVHDYGVSGFRVFSPETMGTSFYYWVLYGVCVAYKVFNTTYTDCCKVSIIALSCLMLLSEYGNYSAHVNLQKLKEKNKGKRGIPRGGMFEYVSLAHYFFELISWIIFSLIVRVSTAYLFVIYSLISMSFLALEKHKGYIKYFGEEYPKNRKAIIPFIL